MHRRIIGTLLTVIISSVPVLAGPVGPRKPSQIITLRCFDVGANCSINSTQGGQLVSDGTLTNSGYTVPAGQVFVVTSMSASIDGAAGTSDIVSFITATLTISSIPITYSPAGIASAYKEFPTGVVLKPTALSIEFVTGSGVFITGVVNGYLTKDK